MQPKQEVKHVMADLPRETWEKLEALRADLIQQKVPSKIIGIKRSTAETWRRKFSDKAIRKTAVKLHTLARFCRGLGLDGADAKVLYELSQGQCVEPDARKELAKFGLDKLAAHDQKQLAEELNKLLPEQPLTTAAPVVGPRIWGRHFLPAQPPRRLFGDGSKLVERLGELYERKKGTVVTIGGGSWSLGGVGKTSVVTYWLSRLLAMEDQRIGRVFIYGFNDQGLADQLHTSADEFLQSALEFFGDAQPSRGSSESQAARLAESLCAQPAKTILVLDGLESLQHPPRGATPGNLKHRALASFLRILAHPDHGFQGLCIITSRQPVTELSEFEQIGTAIRGQVGVLSDEQGAAFLKSLGVKGARGQLRKASCEFGGHPLTLRLLGSYLARFHHGDVAQAWAIQNLGDEVVRPLTEEAIHDDQNTSDEQRIQAARSAWHFLRMMACYAEWYKEKPELCLLRVLSLFNGPATQESVNAVIQSRPPIEYVTDKLHEREIASWRRLAEDLQHGGLVQINDHETSHVEATTAAVSYELHPSIRAYFADDLWAQWPSLWREGHRRLCAHFAEVASIQPESLAQFSPLYQAVAHGCRAGDVSSAWDLYWAQIVRPDPQTHEGQFFSLRRFGCYDEELRALSHFFATPWSVIRPDLDERARGLVQGTAGFCLRALGKPREALSLMRASEVALENAGDALHACRVAGYLSEILRTLGELKEARQVAERCVGMANATEHPWQKIYQRTTLADMLHWQGKKVAALAKFEEARDLSTDRLLLSIPSVRYCELLLTLKKYGDTIVQAERALAADVNKVDLLACALHHLYRAVAGFHVAKNATGRVEAIELATEAIKELTEAGLAEHLALGWLALASLRRTNDDFKLAFEAIKQALRISQSCGAKLTNVDCELEFVRIEMARHRESGSNVRLIEAQAKLDAIRQLVEDEYWLRKDEWQQLHAELGRRREP